MGNAAATADLLNVQGPSFVQQIFLPIKINRPPDLGVWLEYQLLSACERRSIGATTRRDGAATLLAKSCHDQQVQVRPPAGQPASAGPSVLPSHVTRSEQKRVIVEAPTIVLGRTRRFVYCVVERQRYVRIPRVVTCELSSAMPRATNTILFPPGQADIGYCIPIAFFSAWRMFLHRVCRMRSFRWHFPRKVLPRPRYQHYKRT